MSSTRKRQFRKKVYDDEDVQSATEKGNQESTRKDSESPAQDEDVSSVLQEALDLRRFRRRTAGMDINDLNRGDRRKKKEKVEPDPDPWKLKSGGGIISIEEIRGRTFGGNEGAKVTSGGSFATESNAMDTERHMREYIERELRKRRGAPTANAASEGDEKSGAKDIHDELFQIPDHLRTKEKPVSEGNVTLSTSMLTAIPEVDLGISVKLRNIEETEKAKRTLVERTIGIANERSGSSSPALPGHEFSGANMVASERYWTGHRYQHRRGDHGQSGNDQAGSHGAGDVDRPNPDRRTMATDEIVMERFKKRIRRG